MSTSVYSFITCDAQAFSVGPDSFCMSISHFTLFLMISPPFIHTLWFWPLFHLAAVSLVVAVPLLFYIKIQTNQSLATTMSHLEFWTWSTKREVIQSGRDSGFLLCRKWAVSVLWICIYIFFCNLLTAQLFIIIIIINGAVGVPWLTLWWTGMPQQETDA